MILFYCNAMRDLAESIAEDERVRLGEIEWDEFPDGFPNVFIENVEQVRNADIAFLASLTPETLFEQMAVIYALPKYGARSFKIILPYFPVGTMDRVVRMGEITTAKSLARMFSEVECGAELVMYDLHNAGEWHYFNGPIAPRLESAISLFKNALILARTGQTIFSVVFPDEGAYKRFGHMFKTEFNALRGLIDWNIIICHKERFGSKRKVKIIEGDPKGKNVVIVDDLVMTGGTILECARALDRRGAKSVSAYATHAVFPNKSFYDMKNFPFANFWITDSCPETIKAIRTVNPITKFEVLSLAPSITNVLKE